MKSFWNITFLDERGRPKQGHEYQTLHNMYDSPEIGIILRWHNGKLHDDGEFPAVEFQDSHIEHYRNGLLHNVAVNDDGKLRPAIISGYGAQFEYYIDGKQVR
jgi:hypothetical protein